MFFFHTSEEGGGGGVSTQSHNRLLVSTKKNSSVRKIFEIDDYKIQLSLLLISPKLTLVSTVCEKKNRRPCTCTSFILV